MGKLKRKYIGLSENLPINILLIVKESAIFVLDPGPLHQFEYDPWIVNSTGSGEGLWQ